MKKRILVVEDDPVAAKTLAAYLQHVCRGETDLDVVIKNQAHSAIQVLMASVEATQTLQCIITDFNLGKGPSGFEVVRYARNHCHKSIPIVVMSGEGGVEVEQQALELGANYFLPKPLRLTTFSDIVGRIL
jgi:CheY-like chemotaxis protein